MLFLPRLFLLFSFSLLLAPPGQGGATETRRRLFLAAINRVERARIIENGRFRNPRQESLSADLVISRPVTFVRRERRTSNFLYREQKDERG